MSDNGQPAPAFGGMKVVWSTAIVIILLTAAVYIFFDYENMPLDAASTSVVALAMVLLVSGARWLWSRSRQRGKAK
ncbi:MAG: hypothetical protein JO097_20695 [Acidobacteriaceae bacterium]|nr:hypothetical protein [Acidobacteriaceae bacterium]MBV9767255.1 hypothetical protein [Acidobacteriaceae bacterium]